MYSADKDDTYTWKNHAVRLLDGTTFRLKQSPDLIKTYGQASNGKGLSYWVVIKSLIACCPFSKAVVAFAEGGISEPAMVSEIMKKDPETNSIYVGDRAFGVYRVAQVAKAYGKKVLVRLEKRTALRCLLGALVALPRRQRRLIKLSGSSLSSGQETQIQWKPLSSTKVEPGQPTDAITGRVIYVQLRRQGFRPIDLYLFTDLMDTKIYSIKELVAT